MRYPELATELVGLLENDQSEKKDFARRYFNATDKAALEPEKLQLQSNTEQRSRRMLEILAEIGEPSLSNIGDQGAMAMSVLASHDISSALDKVLTAFERVYARDKRDCRYQSIPAMFDASRLAKHRPQRFGTQWFFDDTMHPFLPTVEDFEHVNERRQEYGIEPLRWPKSLAIPESEQPWLTKPITDLIMRDPTSKEYEQNVT